MDSSRGTALHAAAVVNYPGGVAALLKGSEKVGMGVSTKMDALALQFDTEGSTPLHIAAAGGFREVVEILLNRYRKFLSLSFEDSTLVAF